MESVAAASVSRRGSQRQKKAAGAREKDRHHALLMGFAKRYHGHLGLCAEDIETMDVDAVKEIVREYLQQFRSTPFQTYADAAHLSDFRRAKELVHEASARVDDKAAGELAVAVCASGVEEFPDVFPGLTKEETPEFVATCASVALQWLDARFRLSQSLLEFCQDEEATAQLRFKRVLLEIRRTVRDASCDSSTESRGSECAEFARARGA
mmetsp:Transcript_10499/g.26670  ORF Transcript_10499/g.26670 Transcript_10499/m.26670 type:complete len:210 (-) Transcript_10499:1057-1686(-)